MARSIDAAPPAATLDDLRPALDDAQARGVVASVLAGDRDAFRVLVERESAAVFRICYRVLGNLDEAQEATQETFVSAFRSLPGWRGDGSFQAWLARIALHVALRRTRRKQPVAWIDPANPEPPTMEPRGGESEAGQRRLAQALHGAAVEAAPMTDPAALALQGERAEAVRTAVLGLDQPYREVLALRYFGELSVPEIARATGRPEGTVKTHIHRGLARLRGPLGSVGGET